MGRSEKKSLESYFVVLIIHVIKWHSQPWARSISWINSIRSSRKEIGKILSEHPSLVRLVDLIIPEACLKAIKKAEKEMGFPPTYTNPSKEDLLDKDYKLDSDN